MMKSIAVVSVLLALGSFVLEPACFADPNRELVDAAERGDAARISALIARGADVNAFVAGRGTPLSVAAKACRADAVELLLDKGAKTDGREACADGALILAAWKCPAGLSALLIDRGADVNARDTCTGESPLSCAAQMGRTDTVALLIDRGADVEARTFAGFTPLTLAWMFLRGDAARVLRARGAGVFSAAWPLAAFAAALALLLRLVVGLRRRLIRRLRAKAAAAGP